MANANATLSHYLEQATDYYEQGFLRSIEYLRNVGERNRLRRNHLRHSIYDDPTATTAAAISSGLNDSPRSNASATELQQSSDIDVVVNNEEDFQQNRHHCICNPILKIIAKKRSFRIYRFNDKEKAYPLDAETTSSALWPIRVRIKPADSATVLLTQTSGTGTGRGNCKSSTNSEPPKQEAEDRTERSQVEHNDSWYSMNLQLQQQQQQRPNYQYNQQTTSAHHNYPAKEFLIDALIGNLQELEIDEYPLNLPRITLSDYTDKYPTELQTSQQQEQPNEALHLLEGKRSLNSFLLSCQENNIELPLSTLGVPTESSDYRSEAKPP